MTDDKTKRTDVGKLVPRWLNSGVILLKICGSFLIVTGIVVFRISVRDTLTLLNLVSGIELLQEAGVGGFSAIGWFGYIIFSNERTSSIDPAFLPCVEKYDHPKIKSALSEYSPNEVMQQAKQLSAKGLHRLDDETLLSRTLIFRKFLSEADIHLCSRLVKGTVTAKEIQFLVGKLDPQSRELFCEIALDATIAELRQISPPVSLTEAEIDKAFLSLIQSVPEHDADRLINAFNTIDQAADSEVCWLGKTLYGTNSSMEEPSRSHMARALVME